MGHPRSTGSPPTARAGSTPTFYGGGGGGFSNLFNRPSYQNGIVPAGSPAGRGVPDVAMVADPTTGMMIGLTQQFPDGTYYDEYRAGGTSLAAPLFAGVQALASQAQHARLGFANPRIYALARQAAKAPAASKAFHDITNAYDGVANVRADFADGISAANGLVYYGPHVRRRHLAEYAPRAGTRSLAWARRPLRTTRRPAFRPEDERLCRLHAVALKPSRVGCRSLRHPATPVTPGWAWRGP